MMRTLLALLTVALLGYPDAGAALGTPAGHPNAGAVLGTPAPQGIDAPRISQQDFKKLIAAKNVIIVDTRNQDAFPLGHIPGAILLPLEGQMTWPESHEKTVATLLATTKTVVTYCA
jgi:predicted sulfurtransferase